jgi:hypothetical protein
LPWRCHRFLISDALVVRGVEVVDIIPEQPAMLHLLGAFARGDGRHLTYPRPDHTLF